MEDEELNEEIIDDPDEIREIEDEKRHYAEDAGEEMPSEEPASDYAAIEEMRQRISVLEDRIGGLMDSISSIIESGGTIMEASDSMQDSEDDNDEPYLYLEDLDYSI